MLNRKVLIDKLGKEYEPMIKKISIPDFTKCIAQYSGINIQYLDDNIIEEYLTDWARNKKYIFDLFGDIRVDMPITFVDEDRDYCGKILDIAKDFPVYYPWLNMFRNQVKNKIDYNSLYWQDTDTLKKIFPNYKIDGVTMTHFFKNKIAAPDELVTAIGRVFENSEVEATYTLSIDPVDIMLSSENPYNWTSCYRLEHFEESHSDGCLAGVLDESTVISYIWNREGKFSLYDEYEFKNIRYKKVRITLAFNKTFNAIHFNSVYPWKGDCSDDFKKLIRNKVETYLAEKTGKTNLWRKWNWETDRDKNLNPVRIYNQYGYGEYDCDYVWLLKDEEEYAPFKIYSEGILCPCGCGDQYIGSDGSDYLQYNGEGHTHYNWFEEESDEEWCDYADDYVTCDHDCAHCSDYNRNHAVCSIDNETSCNDRDLWDAEYDGDADWTVDNIIRCNPEHCQGCPLYRQHHPEAFENEDEQSTPSENESNQENVAQVNINNESTFYTVNTDNMGSISYTWTVIPDGSNVIHIDKIN